MTRDFILDLLTRVVLPLVVVHWGLRIYRAQRRFDRRVDWYIRTYAQINEVRLRFHEAGIDQQRDPQGRGKSSTDAALISGRETSHLLAEGFMFGVHTDHLALWQFTKSMKEEDARLSTQGFTLDPETLTRIQEACLRAAVSLAEGARREFALPVVEMDRVLAGWPASTRLERFRFRLRASTLGPWR